MSRKAERSVILDASPLILLARAEMLDLLDLFDAPLLVPDAVAREVRAKGEEDPAARCLDDSRFEIVESPPTPKSIRRFSLGAGETAVLTLARRLPGALVLLDDGKARRAATSLKVPIVGTAGLILAAKRRGVFAEARPRFDRLIAAGLYLSGEVYEELLRRAGEPIVEPAE